MGAGGGEEDRNLHITRRMSTYNINKVKATLTLSIIHSQPLLIFILITHIQAYLVFLPFISIHRYCIYLHVEGKTPHEQNDYNSLYCNTRFITLVWNRICSISKVLRILWHHSYLTKITYFIQKIFN